MSEVPEVNPLDRIFLETYELPDWDNVSEEKQQAILDGPGWVHEPVEQTEFADAETFVYKSNNFSCYFGSRGVYELLAQATPAFQRFKILYPEALDYLDEQRLIHREYPPQELQDVLFKAYKIMSHLIDKNDPYVTRNGEVDTYFLCR
jgi:hypothetical protein